MSLSLVSFALDVDAKENMLSHFWEYSYSEIVSGVHLTTAEKIQLKEYLNVPETPALGILKVLNCIEPDEDTLNAAFNYRCVDGPFDDLANYFSSNAKFYLLTKPSDIELAKQLILDQIDKTRSDCRVDASEVEFFLEIDAFLNNGGIPILSDLK